MTILVDNTLAGASGQQVTNARLAATAETGTVTIASAGARAVYDDTHTIHSLPTIRISSGHHRAETPRLRVTLPPSGPWAARWYTWMPPLQDAGHGTGEVRSAVVWPEYAWVVHATAAGNIGTRLHLPDLAAPSIQWDEQDGSATTFDQWWRIEMVHADGLLQVRAYPGHDATGYRGNAWNVQELGRTLDLTGYRWHRRATLYWGDQGAEVTDLQRELINLGYDLGQWGADGHFGDATFYAVQDFQQVRGVTPVDGIPGPETRAAMDLALGRVPPPLWVSHLTVTDDSTWIGPAEPEPEPETPTGAWHVGLLPI